MSEETEGQDASAEAAAGGVSGAEPAAVALALGGASREKADEFLDNQNTFVRKQGALVDDQRHHLHEQLTHLRLGIWEKRFGVLLRIATAFTGLVIAVGLAFMIWNAAHDDGLVVEAFSVPPDLAAQGRTGQVMASQMLDDLSSLMAQSSSARIQSSYANNWGDDLKVEIPETGVSLGEFDRYLHRLLGHQTHISGEVVHTAAGLAVTARVGSDAGMRFSGSDIDALVEQAADAIYRRTQPYRYGVYLNALGRQAEGEVWYEQHATSGPVIERAWASGIGLFNTYLLRGRVQDAQAAAQTAVRLKPDFSFGWSKVGVAARELGQSEAALAAWRRVLPLLTAQPDLQPDGIDVQKQQEKYYTDDLVGDWPGEERNYLASIPGMSLSDPPAKMVEEALSYPGANLATVLGITEFLGRAMAEDHDLAAARHLLSAEAGFKTAMLEAADARHDQRGAVIGDQTAQAFRLLALQIAQAVQDWASVRALATASRIQEPKLDAAYSGMINTYMPTQVWPFEAEALARGGDFKAAHALIDRTPGDCDLCLRERGTIDALEKNSGGADFWFVKAESLAPSIPFADNDWGRAFLDRKQPDAAVEKFALSSKKSPHFADPLEGWGEALMAKSQSHLALSRFAEADKHAPNWGRLHLKWGEALVYTGKKDEAKAQFARAAGFDLTPSEKAELARHP